MVNGKVTFPNIDKLEDLAMYEFFYVSSTLAQLGSNYYWPGNYLVDNNGDVLTSFFRTTYPNSTSTTGDLQIPLYNNSYYSGSMYYRTSVEGYNNNYYYYYLLQDGANGWRMGYTGTNASLSTYDQSQLLKVINFSNRYASTDDPSGASDYTGGNSQVGLTPDGQKLGAPEIDKKLYDNVDGTYTLALDVEGNSFSEKNDIKTDVVIILDKSGSMKEPVPGDNRNRLQIAQEQARGFIMNLLAQNAITPDAPYTSPW